MSSPGRLSLRWQAPFDSFELVGHAIVREQDSDPGEEWG